MNIKLFRKLLVHPSIKEIRGKGLMLAMIVESPELASKLILKCKEKGVLLFWLLFENKAIRITPPLTISEEEILNTVGSGKNIYDLDQLIWENRTRNS